MWCLGLVNFFLVFWDQFFGGKCLFIGTFLVAHVVFFGSCFGGEVVSLLDLVLGKCLILGSSFGGDYFLFWHHFWWGLCKDVMICDVTVTGWGVVPKYLPLLC